jgi:ATP-dependent DNA helicase RecG
MLTVAELEALFLDMESDRVERKASLSERDAIRKAICAYANDLPAHGKPGVIFVGVKDNGECAHFQITDERLRTLADMRSDGNTLPPPLMTVQRHVLRGCEVAVVVVSPSDNPPVRYNGRVWIRVGPRLAVATAEEERRLAERRRASDLPFDCRPVPDATLNDLDLVFFQRDYLPSAVALDVLAQNQRPLDQQLASLRFLTPAGLPNYAAILILGYDLQRWLPGAYVQFLRIDGVELTDPIRDQKALSGPLYAVLSRLDELLEINIATATTIAGSAREVRQPDYPIVALQQLVRNALMHRAYEGTNAPVRIYWFSDRIEISNPGGLYGQVNPENFGQGVTDYRNPLVAEAMKVMGYVQRFGLGLPLAKRELEKNGNPPPEFQFQASSVLVVVRSVR